MEQKTITYMTGQIANLLEVRQFGFVEGEDGHQYFFRFGQLDEKNRISGTMVKFRPSLDNRGRYCVLGKIKPSREEPRYILPKDVFVSKSNDIGRYEVLQRFEWSLVGSVRGAPRLAREEMKEVAKELGANALLNLTYSTDEEVEFNGHKYTVHYYTADLAVIGKRDLKGSPYKPLDTSHIDKLMAEEEESSGKSSNSVKKVIWGLIIFGIFLGLIYTNQGNAFLAFFILFALVLVVAGMLCQTTSENHPAVTIVPKNDGSSGEASTG